MARRPTLRERQKVIASVIAMWFQLMQQYMVLLSKLAVAQTLLAANHRADPTFIVLPLPRIVYRGRMGALDGMHVSVRARIAQAPKYRNRKGQTTINVLGVCNQNLQFVYCLSGWPGSAHDSRVLKDALARSDCFSVPAGTYYLCDAGYTNARGFLAPYRSQRYHLTEWGRHRPATKEENYNMRHSRARNVIECSFGIMKMRWALLRDTSCLLVMSRAYRAWSQQEEQVLFDILHSLHDAGSIQAGTLKDCGYTDIEKRLKVLVPNTKHTADSIKGKFRQFKGKFQAQYHPLPCTTELWLQSHKLAAGLNNTKLPRWEDLCKILEVNRADGRESMTARDAASRLDGQLRRSKTTFDQYAAETTPMMEDLVNQGYDMHAEGLKDVEDDTATKESTDKGKATSSAGSKRSRNQMTDDYLAGINAQMEIFQETIARTTANIERLTNNWCLPEDVASRRALLVEEIERLPGISYRQGLLAIRIMMKDHADMETFCMLPSDEMKADFILTILE
ncbi:Putative nuclease HARBI1 [Linum perenne]